MFEVDASLRIKWFVHRHYLIIVASALVLSFALAIALYVVDANLAILIGIIGTLLSFVYFVQQQQLEEARLFKELSSEFNQRYDELNQRLNNIQRSTCNVKRLRDCERDTLFDYFNLCAEEYLFYKKGYVYPEAWQAWVEGMKEYFEDERVADLWNGEPSKGSYYGFGLGEQFAFMAPKSDQGADQPTDS